MILRNLLKNNNIVRVLAFILAAILWLFVSGEEREPSASEVRYTFHDVSLSRHNLEEDFIVTKMPESVIVVLQGAPEAFDGLSPADLEAYVDLKGKNEGRHDLFVKGYAPSGLTIVRFEPSRVEIKLEKLVTRQMTVQVVTTGKPADKMKVGEILLEPREIFVQGTKDCILNVSCVGFTVIVKGAEKDIIETHEIKAYDECGQEVRGVILTPSQAKAHVSIDISDEKGA